MSRVFRSKVVCWTVAAACAVLAAQLLADPPEKNAPGEIRLQLSAPAGEPAAEGTEWRRIRDGLPYRILRAQPVAEPPLSIGGRQVWPPEIAVAPPVNCLAQTGRTAAAGGADPCRLAAEIARMPPCLDRDDCLAYDTWRDAFGKPHVRKAPLRPRAGPWLPEPLPAGRDEAGHEEK